MKYVLILGLLISVGSFVACNEDDDETDEVKLQSFGPALNVRGGELKIIGLNLDQVETVVLPVDVAVTSFTAQTSTLITLTIPDEVSTSGKLYLVLKNGDEIESVSPFGIVEPITIVSIAPEVVRPGENVTITGTYLNLVSGMNFETLVPVDNADFVSQSQTEIVVTVPMNAQTGPIILSDSLLITVESEGELTVKVPAATSISPTTVKAGGSLTITGTDLDLVTRLEFGGLRVVERADFTSQNATTIVVDVPDNAQAGEVTLYSASPLSSKTSALSLVAPAITGFGPSPVKLGGDLTITGTNLDLVSSVTFGGGDNGTIQSTSETELVVTVPATATAETISLNTNAETSVVTASAIAILQPTITSFTPTTVNTIDEPSITITGTDLDNVASIEFEGGWSTEVEGTATTITVDVVPGSLSGSFKLILTNGDEVESADELTINPDVPTVTGITEAVDIGGKVVLTGSNFDVEADVFVNDSIRITRFGEKSSTAMEFSLPISVLPGVTSVKFVTTKNEVYVSPLTFVINGLIPLTITVFDDAIAPIMVSGDGWSSQADYANTEVAKEGTTSVKATYTGNNGGNPQFGTWGLSAIDISGVTKFVFSVYGGAGTDGLELNVNVKTTTDAPIPIEIAEGVWTDIEIPLSEWGLTTQVSEIWFQDTGWSGEIYIDYVGFR